MKNLVFLFVLFGFVNFMSIDSILLDNRVLVYGNTVKSSFDGDLYNFDVDLYGIQSYDSLDVEVYMYLVFPEGNTLLYQLDDVHHRLKRSYLSYSCTLCLTQVGKYYCNYFVVDQKGNKVFDPRTYDFYVFADANESELH